MSKCLTPAALMRRPPVPLNERRALSAAEVADAYGVSLTFVKELTKAGRLKAYPIGKRRLYNPRECDEAIFRDPPDPSAEGAGND